MVSLLWHPMSRTVHLQEFNNWVIVPQLRYSWAVFLQSACQERPSIIPGDPAGQKSLRDQENLLSAQASGEEVVFGGKGIDLITIPSNLFFLFLTAAAINAHDWPCRLLILFCLDFHYTQYLWLGLLCMFLFILLSQVMGNTHGWVLSPISFFLMCSPLKKIVLICIV